ncbi:MAG: 4Fe-4S binding protein [Deltaproteobacteria bacterium]
MADKRIVVPGDPIEAGPPVKVTEFGQVAEYIHKIVSRREFLQVTGAVGLGAATFYLMGCGSSGSADATPRQVFVANAQGMIVATPSRCVGCRRCELACSEFNNGKSQPSIARIKVGRNYNLGPDNAVTGFMKQDGTWGNHRIVAETCHQCPHPVPCQLACPNGAIEVVPPVNARVVNADKCRGCGICGKACPWAMTSLDGPVDGATTKATKCFLCNGDPECVKACPAGAIQYVPWQDVTKSYPPRQVVPASIQLASDVKDTCNKCH